MGVIAGIDMGGRRLRHGRRSQRRHAYEVFRKSCYIIIVDMFEKRIDRKEEIAAGKAEGGERVRKRAQGPQSLPAVTRAIRYASDAKAERKRGLEEGSE